MAGASFTLRFKTDDLSGRFRALIEKAPHACARALNRANTTMRAVQARNMSADVGLKVGVVKEQLKMGAATPARLSATLSASGKRIPLIEFNARGPEPSMGRGRGVTARLKGGRGRYPHAFIATMRSGHRGVFQRVRRSRLPIVELHGPSLPKVFIKVGPIALAAGEAALAKNLQSEFTHALRQVAASR